LDRKLEQRDRISIRIKEYMILEVYIHEQIIARPKNAKHCVMR
jgi:hypothetical protein